MRGRTQTRKGKIQGQGKAASRMDDGLEGIQGGLLTRARSHAPASPDPETADSGRSSGLSGRAFLHLEIIPSPSFSDMKVFCDPGADAMGTGKWGFS